jgi:hypothetical protein
LTRERTADPSRQNQALVMTNSCCERLAVKATFR